MVHYSAQELLLVQQAQDNLTGSLVIIVSAYIQAPTSNQPDIVLLEATLW